MAVERTDPPTLKRVYPHVDDIDDWRARQTIRLLWDRVFDLEARLQAAESTTGDLVNTSNRQDDDLVRVEKKAGEALATAEYVLGERGYTAPGGGGGGPSGPLTWVWIDRGGGTVAPPSGSSGGPTTIDEWRDYFYSLMGETLGENADDYEAVLQALIDDGMLVNMEIGEVPDAAMPFYGIHLNVDAGGHPRGRVQLPTTAPDALGYYRHEYDVVD